LSVIFLPDDGDKHTRTAITLKTKDCDLLISPLVSGRVSTTCCWTSGDISGMPLGFSFWLLWCQVMPLTPLQITDARYAAWESSILPYRERWTHRSLVHFKGKNTCSNTLLVLKLIEIAGGLPGEEKCEKGRQVCHFSRGGGMGFERKAPTPRHIFYTNYYAVCQANPAIFTDHYEINNRTWPNTGQQDWRTLWHCL